MLPSRSRIVNTRLPGVLSTTAAAIMKPSRLSCPIDCKRHLSTHKLVLNLNGAAYLTVNGQPACGTLSSIISCGKGVGDGVRVGVGSGVVCGVLVGSGVSGEVVSHFVTNPAIVDRTAEATSTSSRYLPRNGSHLATASKPSKKLSIAFTVFKPSLAIF